MQEVQARLDFPIETPSDNELIKRFIIEADREDFIHSKTKSFIGPGKPLRTRFQIKRARKVQRRARGKSRA